MKKFFQQLVLSLLFINLGLTIAVYAADPAPTKPGDVYVPLETLQKIGTGTNLPNFDAEGQHPDAPPEYLQPGVATLTSPVLYAIDIMRLLASTVAIIIIFIMAGKLMSSPSEETATNSKRHLVWGVLGLILIQFANVLVKKMFFGEQGEAFEDAGTSELFAEETVAQVRGIVGFIQIFIAVVAVLVIIVRGFALVVSTGEEEALTKARQHIFYAIGGLFIVGLSEIVVIGFIFPDKGESLLDVEGGKSIIISVTNYISSFVAILSFAVLFYAGYRYVVSGGNEEVTEKVKKTAIGAVIGLLIALGAFAVVNTFLDFDSARPEQTGGNSSAPPPVDG